MNIRILIVACIMYCCNAQAQNLVPNPSFEDINSCANWFSNIVYDPSYTRFPYLDKWTNPVEMSTSDYNHTCSRNTPVGVPGHTMGYQWPRTGKGYVGIFASIFVTGLLPVPTQAPLYQYREYIEARLKDSMKVGHQYYVSFYTNMCNMPDSDMFGRKVVLDKIGFLFTDTMIRMSEKVADTPYIRAEPSVTSPAGHFITDTLNWVKVQGIYTATSNKQWLTIGYFEPHGNMNYLRLYTQEPTDSVQTKFSYIYIDDVCVFDMNDPITTSRRHVVCKLPVVLNDTLTGSMYRWNTGDTTAQVTISDTGVYYRETWGECAYYVDTFYIIAQPSFDYGFQTVCKGEKNRVAWLTPARGDTTYYKSTWADETGRVIHSASFSMRGDTLRELEPGIYTINLQSSNGCDTTVTINLPPDYTVSFMVDTLICEDDVVRFQNTSADLLSTWHWEFGTGDTSNEQQPSYQYSMQGSYQAMLVGYNNVPCYDTMSTTVVVDPSPAVNFRLEKDELCVSERIMIEPTYTEGLDSLLWNFGDGRWLYLKGAPEWVFSDPGPITITAAGKFRACADAFFKDSLYVYSFPTVNLGQDTTICPEHSAITLSNVHRNNLAEQRSLWSTGAISEYIDISTAGKYWLVVDNHGCMTTDSIQVDRGCYVNIPNAFSPNGDGLNDYFFPRELLSENLEAFHMEIFNRWGLKVFSTDVKDGRGWDGAYNGISQPKGVYIYAIKAIVKGVVQQYKGNMTLFR